MLIELIRKRQLVLKKIVKIGQVQIEQVQIG